MNLDDIPVRVVGPGSQGEGEESLSYMSMPSGMSTYVRPQTPEPDEIAHFSGAREAMAWLRNALDDYQRTGRPLKANLGAIDDASRTVINQVIGEGEVSVTFEGGLRARTQESVLAGIWRTFCLDDEDQVIADVLEVGSVPAHVVSPDRPDEPLVTDADGAPADMTNALSILVELSALLDRYRSDGTPGIINLSLLPLSDAEVEFVDARLGRGPVDILSRAYGKCQIIGTRTRDVWWVRYYNSMNTLILNTLEVIRVPEVVCAAPEDLADSAVRLEEILAPYDLGIASGS